MKMTSEIKGLTLNNRYFELAELIGFCETQIKAEAAPVWKLDVYRFILDFLSDSDNISQRTSGTTGTPKTIELPKSAMLTSAQNTIDFFRLKKDDVAVLCLTIQYIAGKMMVVRALLAGLNLHLIEPVGTPDFAGIDNIDFCAMVPMQANHLLKNKKWPKLKTLILGGAETGNELLQQLQTVATKVYETYGMAETSSHVALKRINGKDRKDIFTALPGVQLSGDDRDCLVINTTYLPDTLITNDRVEFVAPNQFKWLGRFDNVINSGGLKIQPETLEKQFQEIIEMPCAVLGIQDELLGQKMILAVESSTLEDSAQIQNQLAPHFEKKMLPKQIYFLKEFPRNESFKVDRKALLKLL